MMNVHSFSSRGGGQLVMMFASRCVSFPVYPRVWCRRWERGLYLFLPMFFLGSPHHQESVRRPPKVRWFAGQVTVPGLLRPRGGYYSDISTSIVPQRMNRSGKQRCQWLNEYVNFSRGLFRIPDPCRLLWNATAAILVHQGKGSRGQLNQPSRVSQ